MIDHPSGPMATPEFAFLVHASRWPYANTTIAQIREAACALRDPGLLRTLSRQHHLCGFVARALAHCDSPAAATLLTDMRQDALSLAEEQFRQLVQTRDAVHALERQAIPVVVLKGAPAAISLYGEVGVRCSVDIDLLVAKNDVGKAALVLEDMAYRRSDPPCDADARHLRVHARYAKDWGFDHCHSDTGIELHWRLFQNPRLLPRVSTDQAIRREIVPGVTLPVLPTATAMLYAVVHGAEHGWARLKWLADLANALQRFPALADGLFADAREQGVPHLTMAALLLCHEVYGTALPSSDKDNLAQTWRTRTLLGISRDCLLDASEHGSATRKNLSHYLFSADPRHWWHELAYDMCHDTEHRPIGRIMRRAGRVLKLPISRRMAPI